MSWWGSPKGKAIKFYVSSTPPSSASPAGPEQQALDRSGPRRTRTASPGSHHACQNSTASARSQWSASPGSEWSLPDPNSKPRISVVPSGPERQALDQSGPCRTRTASTIDQSPITVVPAGPEQQALDQSTRSQWSLPDLDHKEPYECISDRKAEKMSEDLPDKMSEYMSDRRSEYMSDRMQNKMSEYMSDRMMRMSECMSARMSEYMSDWMPKKMQNIYVR